MHKINNFFRKKIAKIIDEKGDPKPFVKRAIYLSGLNIDSDSSLKFFVIAKGHAKKMDIKVSDHFLADIARLAEDEDDVLYKIVKSQIKNKPMQKVAYPNPGLSPDSVQQEVDLNRWIDLVRKVYVDCRSGKRSKEEALSFYSNTLPKEERNNFLNWIKHYLSGENLKYSEKKGIKMKKESVFQSDLGQGNNPYAHDGSGFYFQNRNLGNNMPGDSFYSSEGLRVNEDGSDGVRLRQKSSPEKADRRRKLKRDLHAACRRIDKVIREEGFCSEEEYLEIAKLLLELSTVIKKVKLASTVNDLAYRYAKKIEKIGHKRYADPLVKFAQDAEALTEGAQPPVGAEGAEPEAAPVQAEPEQEEAPAGPSQQEVESGVSVPEPDDVSPAKLRDIKPIPGPSAGEYEILAGDINLEDAAKKLDEVAGMLADRRIIRQLAEFDIMLDKIGIASMFPELAESQSKLIDAFSYALTRVTKMMGQLSNAKSLLEAGGDKRLPGTPEQQEEGSGDDLSPVGEQGADAELPADIS